MIEKLKQIQQCLKDNMYAHAEMYLHDAITELENQEPVGRFAKFTDGIWREVTDGSPGIPLYKEKNT